MDGWIDGYISSYQSYSAYFVPGTPYYYYPSYNRCPWLAASKQPCPGLEAAHWLQTPGSSPWHSSTGDKGSLFCWLGVRPHALETANRNSRSTGIRIWQRGVSELALHTMYLAKRRNTQSPWSHDSCSDGGLSWNPVNTGLTPSPFQTFLADDINMWWISKNWWPNSSQICNPIGAFCDLPKASGSLWEPLLL